MNSLPSTMTLVALRRGCGGRFSNKTMLWTVEIMLHEWDGARYKASCFPSQWDCNRFCFSFAPLCSSGQGRLGGFNLHVFLLHVARRQRPACSAVVRRASMICDGDIFRDKCSHRQAGTRVGPAAIAW